MRSIFISDIHLSEPETEKAQSLLRFLRELKGFGDVIDLYLMGDIFDLWLTDHQYFIDKWTELNKEFVRLKSECVEIHYFEGNHDLYLSTYFGQHLGFKVYSGPTQVEWHGLRLYLEHGDQIDKTDYGYRFLRWFLRIPVIRNAVQVLPDQLAAKVGESSSRASRQYTSQRPSAHKDHVIKMIRDHAEHIHKKYGFDFLIAGHVHVKDDFQMGSARAINLGTWLNEPTAFQLNERGEGEWLQI